MTAQVQPFFHAGSSTFSYVVSDPDNGQTVIIDPVLDFDAASARTGTTAAQAIVDHVGAHGLQVPLRLVPADESRPPRWVRQMQSITVVTAP